MNGSRNELGAAYAAADALYLNGVALTIFLDAWSRAGVTPRLNVSAAAHLRHNLVNAQGNLSALREALAVALDEILVEGEAVWQASDNCADGPVKGNFDTPAGSAQGGPSGFSGIGGGST